MLKKILLIGSNGFIGRNALKYFVSKGYDVHSADIIIKESNNYTVLNPENIDFDNLFYQQKYEICINASGAANVGLSFQYPNIDFSLNVVNVFKILDAIRKNNPSCKFINLSSAAVYGNPKSLPISENLETNSLSPYGHHKYYSELICKEFFEIYNIQTVSLRIFSVFGEGLKKQLFWDIYQKIQTQVNGEITLYGTGDESRDFIYILDLLDAIELIIQMNHFKGNVINVSSGIETTIKDAVEIFVRLFNKDIKVVFNNVIKEGDPLNWRADISFLKSIGFASRYTLQEGLGNYYSWLNKLNNED